MIAQHAYSAIMCNLHLSFPQQELTILYRIEIQIFWLKFIATLRSALLVRPPCCLLARVL